MGRLRACLVAVCLQHLLVVLIYEGGTVVLGVPIVDSPVVVPVYGIYRDGDP